MRCSPFRYRSGAPRSRRRHSVRQGHVALRAAWAFLRTTKAEANYRGLEGRVFRGQILGVPAQDVLALAPRVIEARVAQRQGDKAAAIERFEGSCAAALHGAALLVLPGAAVARGRADAGGPTRRSRGAVPARAQARPRATSSCRGTGLPNCIRRAARPTRRASWKRILPRRGSATDSSWSCGSCDPQRVGPPGGGKLTAPAGPHGRGQCAWSDADLGGRTSASTTCPAVRWSSCAI